MNTPTNSAPAPIDRVKSWLERLAHSLDPDYPAAVVSPPGLVIDDPAIYGNERLKPQFVLDDDNNFTGKKEG